MTPEETQVAISRLAARAGRVRRTLDIATIEETQNAISRLAAGLRRIERSLEIAQADIEFLKMAQGQGASPDDVKAARKLIEPKKPRRGRREFER